MARRQLRGVEGISSAIDSGTDLSCILILDDGASQRAEALARRAHELGVAVHRESARSLRRLSRTGEGDEILALEGGPATGDLGDLMRGDGVVFVLAGLRYPGNVGYILRCVEVAGGAGVVIDGEWGEAQREEASRVSIRADRFFPVVDARLDDALVEARSAGRRIVAIETSGDVTPWETNLRDPLLVLIGSETMGIPDSILKESDAVVAIPTQGFIPSYNVQAAVGIILGEWMRQNA